MNQRPPVDSSQITFDQLKQHLTRIEALTRLLYEARQAQERRESYNPIPPYK